MSDLSKDHPQIHGLVMFGRYNVSEAPNTVVSRYDFTNKSLFLFAMYRRLVRTTTLEASYVLFVNIGDLRRVANGRDFKNILK